MDDPLPCLLTHTAPAGNMLLKTDESQLRSGEECVHESRVKMSSSSNEQEGELMITNSRILFVPSCGPASSIELQYREIALHAIASTEDDQRYIFIQLIREEEDEEDHDEDILKIFPLDSSTDKIENLFSAINEMTVLHPDEEESEYETD